MDWELIIKEVQEYRELNLKNLSARVGASAPYLHHLRKCIRKIPSFDIGLAIIKLHPNKVELLK